MRGLILAGGHGTRLRPLTHTSAKQLIPIANKPVLFFGIEALRDAGIRQIVIVVGHTKSEIVAAVGDGSRFGVHVEYVEQDAPRGLAHAVLTAEPLLGREPFMMYLGDNFLLDGVADVVRRFDPTRDDALVLLAHVQRPEEFGVARVEGDLVRAVVEKPARPPSNLGIVGVYVFQPAIFDACRAIRPSARGELEITDAIQHLIDTERRVVAATARGYWKDTGRPEDLLDANRMVLDRLEPSQAGDVDAASRVEFRVVIGKGARVRSSVIRGPALIGEGAVIEDAYVGPFTTIGDGCVVRGSEVENSILLAEAQLVGLQERVSDSLLGRAAVVQGRAHKPRALRFVLGDRSAVGL